MIKILFGEMGTGKSYLGRKLAEEHGAAFIEGDDLLPEHLKTKVASGKPLNLSDVNDFIFDYLLPFLCAKQSENLVVAQALYRAEHRAAVEHSLKECEMIWVKTDFITHVKRLLSRDGGWRWVLNMLISKPFFQKPGPKCKVLVNL